MEQENSPADRIDDLLSGAEEALQTISQAFSNDEADLSSDQDSGLPAGESRPSPDSASPPAPPRYLEIELGRCRLPLSEVLAFRPGAILPLPRRADGSVGLYYDEKKIAEGVLLIDHDHLAVRVTRIVRPEEETERQDEIERR